MVEVQRAVPSEGQPAVEIDTNNHLGNNPGSGTRWAVEFHPPSQKKGGRTKVCRSVDEAKRYIERQAAQQAKRERQEQQRSEGSDGGEVAPLFTVNIEHPGVAKEGLFVQTEFIAVVGALLVWWCANSLRSQIME